MFSQAFGYMGSNTSGKMVPTIRQYLHIRPKIKLTGISNIKQVCGSQSSRWSRANAFRSFLSLPVWQLHSTNQRLFQKISACYDWLRQWNLQKHWSFSLRKWRWWTQLPIRRVENYSSRQHLRWLLASGLTDTDLIRCIWRPSLLSQQKTQRKRIKWGLRQKRAILQQRRKQTNWE